MALEITEFGRSWDVLVYVRMTNGEWKKVGEWVRPTKGVALSDVRDFGVEIPTQAAS